MRGLRAAGHMLFISGFFHLIPSVSVEFRGVPFHSGFFRLLSIDQRITWYLFYREILLSSVSVIFRRLPLSIVTSVIFRMFPGA